MNPNHAVIQRLQEDLISRIASDLRSHFALANFPAAVLKSLPPVRNSIGMKLKLLPPGVFTMGDKGDEHEVTLTKSFMLGIHEVTQTQYERVMGVNPSRCKGGAGWPGASIGVSDHPPHKRGVRIAPEC